MTQLRVFTVAVLLLLGLTAPAHSEEGRLDATLTTIRPTILTNKTEEVVLAGTLQNNTDQTLKEVTAYFVIPANPFRNRADVRDLFTNIENAFGGTRNDLPSRNVTFAKLAPGEVVDFTLKVPFEDLRIDGSEGVYSVGVHVLATDAKGERNPDGIARAYTLLPKIESKEAIATSIIWPFFNPTYRDPMGRYVNADELLALISSEGQLRKFLDAARSTGGSPTSVVIDPALLVALDAIASNRVGPPSSTKTGEYTTAEQDLATRFRDDLLAFAKQNSFWVLNYGRPDLAAIIDEPEIQESVTQTTKTTINNLNLNSRIVNWPINGIASKEILEVARTDGVTPIITSVESLPDWESRYGSIVSAQTIPGPLPVVIDDSAFRAAPNETTDLVNQKIISQAALAVLSQRIDATSRANVIYVMNPNWIPQGTNSIYSIYEVPWITESTTERMLVSRPSVYDKRLGVGKDPATIDTNQKVNVPSVFSAANLRGAIGSKVDAHYFSQFTAESVSSRWIATPDDGTAHTQRVIEFLQLELNSVKIASPRQVTLSSGTGAFPLTISNELKSKVQVKLQLRSTDKSVKLPEPQLLVIEPEQRTTLTINVDLQNQAGSTIIATLTTPNGDPIGRATVLNVRTSAVGAVIWIAMGAAGLLVVGALTRRFRKNKMKND